MDHEKAKSVAYQNSIRDIQSIGQSGFQKLRSVQPLFHPKTEFSSDVDHQNFVTSKPLSGHSRISNG
jgi:hypothetical protein